METGQSFIGIRELSRGMSPPGRLLIYATPKFTVTQVLLRDAKRLVTGRDFQQYKALLTCPKGAQSAWEIFTPAPNAFGQTICDIDLNTC